MERIVKSGFRGLVLAGSLLFLIGISVAAEPFEKSRNLAVGAAPHGMRILGKEAFVVAAGADVIEVIDLASGKIVRRLPVPDTPLDLVRAGEGWLVTSFRSNLLSFIPDRSGIVEKTWQVGKGPSLFVPRVVKGKAYVVSEFADLLTEFDLEAMEISRTFKTGKRPYPADVTHDGVLAFVPNRDDGTVSVIDLLNGKELAKVEACNQPQGGSLSADEVNYLVACGADDVVKLINTATFEVVGTIADGIGKRPFSIAVSNDGNWAFVNNAGGQSVSVINMHSRKVVQRLATGKMPIVLRVFENRLYVATEGSNTFEVFELPERPAKTSTTKNQVVVLGMIHDGFLTSPKYSLEHLRQLITVIKPDYVLTEIPPNRFEAAKAGFEATGKVTESRVSVFPEYVDVLFPLSKKMAFRIVPTAGWNRQMTAFRSKAMRAIRNDASRKDEWQEYVAAFDVFEKALSGRANDPGFIHSDAYDEITRRAFGVYDRLFNDELGTGGWSTINGAHYALIEKALDDHRGEGKRFLITFGSSHKYWFLDELKKRSDIELLDAKTFLDQVFQQ